MILETSDKLLRYGADLFRCPECHAREGEHELGCEIWAEAENAVTRLMTKQGTRPQAGEVASLAKRLVELDIARALAPGIHCRLDDLVRRVTELEK